MSNTYRVQGVGRHQLGYGNVNYFKVFGNSLVAPVVVQGGGAGTTIPAGTAADTKFGIPGNPQLHKGTPVVLIIANAADVIEVEGQLFAGPAG